MDQLLKVGDTIPDFEIKDFEGESFSKDDLLGSPFVLYFYPKDDTPGCTTEACSFRDVMETFEEMDIMIVGISPDSPSSHQSFIDKHELNFPLLSDESFEAARKCGVAKPKKEGGFEIVRTTFLCDEDGVVQWVESPVKIENHVQRLMEAVEKTLV